MSDLEESSTNVGSEDRNISHREILAAVDSFAKYVPLIAIVVGAVLTCGWVSRQAAMTSLRIYGISSDRETLIAAGVLFLCATSLPIVLIVGRKSDPGIRLMQITAGLLGIVIAAGLTTSFYSNYLPLVARWAIYCCVTNCVAFLMLMILKKTENKAHKPLRFGLEKRLEMSGFTHTRISQNAGLMTINIVCAIAYLFLFAGLFGAFVLTNVPGNLGGMLFPRSVVILKDPTESIDARVIAFDSNWIVIEPTASGKNEKTFPRRVLPLSRVLSIDSIFDPARSSTSQVDGKKR